MKRLIKGKGKNSPKEYDSIFSKRQEKGPDWFDLRRWKMLLKYYRGGDIFDIGCLDSNIIEMIPDKNSYWGIDIAEASLGKMRELHDHPLFTYGDVYDLPARGKQMDYIVMGEILEHLEHPEKAIREAIRILKSGGILAISVPLEETGIGEVDRDRHIWSYKKQDIEELCAPYGKVKIKILGSRFFPTYKYSFPHIIAWVTKK